MVPTIDKLLQIQDKDLRIAILKKQIETVPKDKAKLLAEKALADSLMDGAKTAIQDVEKKLKTLEMEMATLKQKKLDLLGKSHQIKKNDEYKAMLHEVEAFDAKVKGLEDLQLTLWDELETAKGKRVEAQKDVDAAKARVEASISDLEVRERNCTDQIAKVEAERDAMTGDVPEDLLRLYRRLLRRTNVDGSMRKALVPLLDNNCGSCMLKVTPQVRHRVLKNEVVTCENCGTILYNAD